MFWGATPISRLHHFHLEVDKVILIHLKAKTENTDNVLRQQIIYPVYVQDHTKEGTFLAIIRDLDSIKALDMDIA